MSDRELLEFAAKAAGIHVPTKKDYPWAYIDESGIFRDISCAGDGTRMSRWNPITDDGDAMRLMVRLRLEPRFIDNSHSNGAEPSRVTLHNVAGIVENIDGDPLAATRRAIVRAAAEIGRQMP